MIQYGDTMILFEDGKPKQFLTVTQGQTYQNKYGAYHHYTFLVKPGEEILSKNGTGPIYLMTPNPHLITETVPHKTQILFMADISMIILKLCLKPGQRVIESGTGSGSLSCSLAAAVGHKGRLFTYEFNKERANNGKELFAKLKINQATCFWRDVYANGFLKGEDTENQGEFPQESSIDAIFLDLPQPWLALDHSKKMIKKGGRICCFSPCIEQVQKTALELKQQGWKNLETLECLKRHFERRVKQEQSLFDDVQKKVCTDQNKRVTYSAGINQAYGHTGYLTFAQYI
ncbi:unnamed protein product (macronuclear) [Paramecium tetraurelia]|uniref:tRNA (adenine(58)-N(1))-methyltransferase n=5 Tax=Paramecium TaxID=5884 RepID=Q6BG57_PARTE|nr:tRNA methyltransferase [Paramecium tetraurelia strain d4-2]XP_001423326.1 uncharacterized protein GSPATT00000363001 [Paramecium tetraurelia]CAH03363.1 tRNA methyltransferase, putative [Paramecium tetraurelia]CAK55928.1 unnamed protein product [Paramecium tetraurelia]|eukprot:XP_001423326.1 hypothetical protein (macronuclear) [Paramecium tetraurelia strain d4-2]